ncbi:imm11 family protein [Pedobacter gandavensis]|uniref:Immunity MXAN-0049 protein domain-containing protein n=1 Tax=Pedobacter gandavensis TaxID=2679963 RepID=A0ABR6ET54_9SPHI|nr:DUF1629 domain-containing protein [Pedobacter gandavensis]MBB2148004.1 hypothetical protein [Pedobacter gandavensis]
MYYRIESSLDMKIIGHSSQIEHAELPADWDTDPTFVGNIEFVKADFRPKMPRGILHKKAKLTDLLTACSPGFERRLLVSKSLKDLWELFDHEHFQFFDCDVITKNLIYEYWLMNPLVTNFEFVDFQNSTVVTRKRKLEGGTFLEEVPVTSLNEFNVFLETLDIVDRGMTFISRVSLLDDIPNDVFVLSHVDGGVGYYVSEKVKKAIEVSNITGIEFAPISLTFHEWTHEHRNSIYG